jgi:hypothetical protein
MPRISAHRRLEQSKIDIYIGLASAQMLLTTSNRLAPLRAPRRGPRNRGDAECFGEELVSPEMRERETRCDGALPLHRPGA